MWRRRSVPSKYVKKVAMLACQQEVIPPGGKAPRYICSMSTTIPQTCGNAGWPPRRRSVPSMYVKKVAMPSGQQQVILPVHKAPRNLFHVMISFMSTSLCFNPTVDDLRV
mmetsp:Transcript_23764/g.42513  ORF Transcript_23764/g.42513 Transcript_23764/m.42513 type:complete len:110 (+) Transcript_23764:1072-1401(+)